MFSAGGDADMPGRGRTRAGRCRPASDFWRSRGEALWKVLPIRSGNRLHLLTSGEPVRDLNAVVLSGSADLSSLNEAHAASVDEPQRPTAERHSTFAATEPGIPVDQFEVLTLDTSRHLVRRVARHRNPVR